VTAHSPAAPRTKALAAVIAATRDRIDAGQDWVAPLDRGLRRMAATWQESSRVCSTTTWHARRAGRDPIADVRSLDGRPVSPQTGPFPHEERARWHIHLTALRFDFRCQTLISLFKAPTRAAAPPADPYIRGHRVFALLGRSQERGLAMLDDLLAEDEASRSREVLHVALQGLWLGHLLPRRAERILQLTALPALSTTPDPIALMRKAGAFRQLGCYRQALDVIDDAIDALPASDPSVHADLVRERALIALALDTAALRASARRAC
jgi:hypothetical protein